MEQACAAPQSWLFSFREISKRTSLQCEASDEEIRLRYERVTNTGSSCLFFFSVPEGVFAGHAVVFDYISSDRADSRQPAIPHKT